MSLKMRSFKKSIIRADLLQLWGLALIYGGMIFFGTFFDFYLNDTTYGNSIPYSFTGSRFYSYSLLANFFGIIAGAVLALRIFSFLYSTRAISFYHGLPFSRKSIFKSKVLSGVILLTVPVLVNFVIVGLSKLCGSAIQIRWTGLFYWLGNQLIYSLLTFSFVTFSVMLSGNILSLLLICLIFVMSPALITGFVHTVCQCFLLGYGYTPESFISYFYIMPDVLLFKARGIIYIAAIPAFLILSFFMYKKRDLERCGEAIVFPVLKTLFVYLAGLLGGIFSYFYFSIWSFRSLAFMLPFGIVAIIIANMINRRGVTLKGAFKHILIFTALVFISIGALKVDIIGFERRIPSIDKVESVTVFPDMSYRHFNVRRKIGRYGITDTEDIKKVMDYHRHSIETGNTDRINLPNNVEITYKLKNGRTLKRLYNVNLWNEKEYFESVLSLDKVKKVLYPTYKGTNLKYVSINLYNFMDNLLVYPDNPLFDKLIEAMDKDIENLSYIENAILFNNSMSFNTPLYADIEFKDPQMDTKDKLDSTYFPISFGFTNTIELLKEAGLYDRFMTANNIRSVGIDKDDDDNGSLLVGDYKVDEIITEPERMREILNELQTGYKNPIWWSDDDGEDSNRSLYNEYIFLDKSGKTHTFVLLKSARK